MKRLLRLGAVVLLFAVALGACGDSEDTNDTSDAVGSEAATTTTAGSTSNGNAASLTVIATDFAFDKKSLTAQASQPLAITLQNDGAVEHNLTIDKLDVDTDAKSDESVVVDTITPAAGTYDYFCEFHPSAMKGTLIVS